MTTRVTVTRQEGSHDVVVALAYSSNPSEIISGPLTLSRQGDSADFNVFKGTSILVQEKN